MAGEPGVADQLGSMAGGKLKDFKDWLMTSKPNYEGTTVGSLTESFGKASLGTAAASIGSNMLSWILPGRSRSLGEGVLGKTLVGGLLGSAFNFFSNGKNDGAGVGVAAGIAMSVLSGDAGIVKKLLFAVAGLFLLPKLASGLSSLIGAFNKDHQPSAPGVGAPAVAGGGPNPFMP
jgi:hypothetical protein